MKFISLILTLLLTGCFTTQGSGGKLSVPFEMQQKQQLAADLGVVYAGIIILVIAGAGIYYLVISRKKD